MVCWIQMSDFTWRMSFRNLLIFYETRSFLCACIEIIKSHFSLQRDIVITTIKQKIALN